MGQEERWQERRSSRGLGMDKKRGQEVECKAQYMKVRRWNRTKLSQRVNGLLVRTGVTMSGGRWKQCGGTLIHFRPFANVIKGDVVGRACQLSVLILFVSLHLLSGWDLKKHQDRTNTVWAKLLLNGKCPKVEEIGFQWKISQLLRLKLSKSSLSCTVMLLFLHQYLS